ncbi:hypothetical protein KMW28_15955 [Flammeovirga yaeyamensis]|uniref:Lipoprotein n=1 Tax=Flammeovirga yaeyamensis TaxID=367791 RepID=A0AAX1N0N0_9BACT|nr:hypothetical protein [Flammeovirga yaeyamensis]MBB3698497.1 hypothetical protein [Flammeovirga yaeyamensis]NMF34154.1 hypothetical protein [Flammeovirga yaeyamensis]QWG01139.1 hypothetical protein KMW28_15955 [Flammeovirga yaeyamensis]
MPRLLLILLLTFISCSESKDQDQDIIKIYESDLVEYRRLHCSIFITLEGLKKHFDNVLVGKIKEISDKGNYQIITLEIEEPIKASQDYSVIQLIDLKYGRNPFDIGEKYIYWGDQITSVVNESPVIEGERPDEEKDEWGMNIPSSFRGAPTLIYQGRVNFKYRLTKSNSEEIKHLVNDNSCFLIYGNILPTNDLLAQKLLQ